MQNLILNHDHIREMLLNSQSSFRVNEVKEWCQVFPPNSDWSEIRPQNFMLLVGYFMAAGHDRSGVVEIKVESLHPGVVDNNYTFNSGDGLSQVEYFGMADHVITDGEGSVTFVGWMVDMEPFVAPPPGGSGFQINVSLDGHVLDASNLLQDNHVPHNWYQWNFTEFTLKNGQTVFAFKITLPKLGGATFNDDYGSAGTGGVAGLLIFSSVSTVAGKWEALYTCNPIAASGGVAFTSAVPPVAAKGMQNSNSSVAALTTIDDVAVSTLSAIKSTGQPFPLSTGQQNVCVATTGGNIPTGVHSVDVHVSAPGDIDTTQVQVTGSDAVMQSQPFTGTGNYNFLGVVFDAVTDVQVSLIS